MSEQIPIAWEQEFSDNWIHLSQQKESKFSAAVRVEDNISAKAFHFDRVGIVEMVKKTSRHADTPLTEVPFSRRRLNFDTFQAADLIDEPDKRKMAKEPTSPTMKTLMMAYNRKRDDIIIAAFKANAQAIDADDQATTVALPAGQTIAKTFGSPSANQMTVAKLIEAKRILWANEVDEDEELFCALGSTQIADLLNTTEVTSSDYNSVKALVAGDINSFMGFMIIRSERLPKSGTDRSCFAWARNGIGLGIVEDKVARLSERADKSYSMQAFVETTMGATRVEDEKVVEIVNQEP